MRNLDAVDSSEDVDAIAGKDGDGGHIGVIKPTKIEHVAEVGLKLFGDDDGGDAVVYEVDYQHGDGG